jgi:acyl carrier protein
VTTAPPMSFAEFWAHVSQNLGMDSPEPVDEGSFLVEDCGFDSFELLGLYALIEDLASAEGARPNPPRLFTTGDAYGHYVSLIGTVDAPSGR